VEGDIPRNTSGNGVVGMASGMVTSMRIGGGVCDEEGESDDWEGEQEMHLW